MNLSVKFEISQSLPDSLWNYAVAAVAVAVGRLHEEYQGAVKQLKHKIVVWRKRRTSKSI